MLGSDEAALRTLTRLANRSVRRAFFLLERYASALPSWTGASFPALDQALSRVLLFANADMYRESLSELSNVLAAPADRWGSYSLQVRLLAYLDWANQSAPGLRAYVPAETLMREFEGWGFPQALIAQTISGLVVRGLVEWRDQWFVDYPEEGRGTSHGYAFDYGHIFSLSPSGQPSYLHDALLDPAYVVSAAADTTSGTTRRRCRVLVAELREVFKDEDVPRAERLDLLLASQCLSLFGVRISTASSRKRYPQALLRTPTSRGDGRSNNI